MVTITTKRKMQAVFFIAAIVWSVFIFEKNHKQNVSVPETPIAGILKDKFISYESKGNMRWNFEVYLPTYQKMVIVNVRSSTYERHSIGQQVSFHYSPSKIYGDGTKLLAFFTGLFWVFFIIVLLIKKFCPPKDRYSYD